MGDMRVATEKAETFLHHERGMCTALGDALRSAFTHFLQLHTLSTHDWQLHTASLAPCDSCTAVWPAYRFLHAA